MRQSWLLLFTAGLFHQIFSIFYCFGWRRIKDIRQKCMYQCFRRSASKNVTQSKRKPRVLKVCHAHLCWMFEQHFQTTRKKATGGRVCSSIQTIISCRNQKVVLALHVGIFFNKSAKIRNVNLKKFKSCLKRSVVLELRLLECTCVFIPAPGW